MIPEERAAILALISRTIYEKSRGNVAELSGVILDDLLKAGYRVTRPDMIPIRGMRPERP